MVNWKKLNENRIAGKNEIAFARKVIDWIVEGRLPTEEFSLRGLWEACGCPELRVEQPLSNTGYILEGSKISEALDSSAFPKITGALINKMVQEAYDLEYGIGFSLVQKFPSSLREETIVGFADDDALREVPEGMPYQEGSITEKYHKIKNRKWGRLISLTEEMVKFDQTGQLTMRARRVGEKAKSKQEEIIMNAVLELVSTGEYAAWRPNGTATTLYSNTSTDPFSTDTLDNVITDTLTDETDLDAAMVLFSAFTDELGDPININPTTLLAGISLMGVAAKILASGQAVKLTLPTGVKNIYAGTIAPLHSAFVDQKLGVKYWLFGDFKKQFVYTEVFPLQTFQHKAGNEQEFERDVIFRFKARFMGGCGAVTNRYVIRSTGAG